MFYRQVTELVTDTPRVDGVSTGRYVHKEHKKTEWGKLNFRLGSEITKNDLVTRWKDEHSHTVNDVFNYVPMVLNYIALKGYKKVLFVGHFNAAQSVWQFPRKSDRSVHLTPSVKSMEETMVDPNIWIQFLPIVKMAYGYTGFEMHTLVPPESRHRQLMHSLYQRYEIDLVPCTKQYKHGRNIEIDMIPDTSYDCVVFGGVPKETEDREFSHLNVRSTFAPYCKEGFDIIDINYQDPDPSKYIGGAVEDNTQWLNEVFVDRVIWDDKFREENEDDRAIEYSILNDMIKSYRG